MNHDSRGWHLPTHRAFKDRKLTYKISCRAFQNFIGGRIDEKQFRNCIGERDDGPSMKRFLEQGYTIKSVRFEAAGVDRDDDYFILEFEQDASASRFK